MRHAVFGRKLGRDIKSRKALLNNLAASIIINRQLTTTLAKAKFASSYVEKLISVAKKNRLSSRRILASTIGDKAFQKLVMEIAPGFEKRTGGYTRITKLMPRRGDSAKMARIELLEWEKQEIKKTAPEKKAKKSNKKTNVVKTKKTASKSQKVKKAVTKKTKK